MVHVIFANQNRNKDLGEMQLKDLLKPGVLVSEDSTGLEMEKDYCTSEVLDISFYQDDFYANYDTYHIVLYAASRRSKKGILPYIIK